MIQTKSQHPNSIAKECPMKVCFWSGLAKSLAAMAIAVLPSGAWAEETDDTPLINDVIIGENGSPKGLVLTNRKLPDYWLGIECMPAPPAVLSQLKLPLGQGLVVGKVQPDGPAAKAGFQEHDLLLSSGETTFAEPMQLVELLDQTKDKELTFNIVRGGEKQTIAVTPAKRPESKEPVADILRVTPGGLHWEALREHLQRSGAPVRMQIFHPGMVLPRGATVATIPDDLKIHFHKEGNKMAQITVERGDQKWAVSEDKINDLPADIRPHVEAILGRQHFDAKLEWNGSARDGGQSWTIPLPEPGDIQDRLERRMNEMSRLMNEIKDQVKDLRRLRQDAKSGGEPAPTENK
jgi:hypothetical protein